MSVYDADVAVGVPMPRPKSNFRTKIPNTATMVCILSVAWQPTGKYQR